VWQILARAEPSLRQLLERAIELHLAKHPDARVRRMNDGYIVVYGLFGEIARFNVEDL
jgi:hypothetical protein